MKIKKAFALAFVFLLLAYSCVKAQTTNSNIWLGSSFKYEVLKDLDVKIEIGHRRTDFYSARIYGDFVLKYKINDFVKLGLGWRHAGENEAMDVFELSDRFNLDLTGAAKQNDFSLKYRIRYQRKHSSWWREQYGYIPKETIRTRLLVNYNFNKKLDFDFGVESFLFLSEVEPMYINKLRYMAGLEYQINKRQNIGIHYIRQQEVQVSNPNTAHILSIDYEIDIKRTLKKLKKKKRKSEKE